MRPNYIYTRNQDLRTSVGWMHGLPVMMSVETSTTRKSIDKILSLLNRTYMITVNKTGT